MKTTPSLVALLFVFLASFATPAAAITPHGRRITGTIQKVDASAREVEMLREDNGKPLTFIWNKLTTFVTGTSMSDAAILRKGARVEVIRHVPFFGEPFASRVLILASDRPTKPANKKRRQ